MIEITETLKAMERIYSPKYGLANRIVTSDLDHKIVSLKVNSYKLSNVIPMFNTFVENAHFATWSGAGSALNLEKSKVNHIEFHTASPGISASNYWITINQQQKPLQFSSVIFDRKGDTIIGKTENVASITFHLSELTFEKIGRASWRGRV